MRFLQPFFTRARVLAVGLPLGLLGCASTVNNLPGIYRIDIQQGNVVDQAMLDQLELGMEKRKVQFALGTPLLTDTFNDDRWEYFYSYRQGKKRRVQRRITLFFEQDRLTYIGGDVKRARGRRPPAPRRETMVTVPPAEPPGLLAGILPGFLGGKKAPVLPHEVTEPTAPTTAPDDRDAPEGAPTEEEAGSIATAAADLETERQGDAERTDLQAAAGEASRPDRRMLTTSGDEDGGLGPAPERREDVATPELPEPPAAVSATAGLGAESQTPQRIDYVLDEELESASASLADNQRGSFYRQLVDRFRRAEPTRDSDRAAPAGPLPEAEADSTTP